ncbi:MAG: tetratricopeptide repeat protein [Leptolyngbya sp.]|nr:tetratricopeptide repeat protein [Leptolyngbya sp.]
MTQRKPTRHSPGSGLVLALALSLGSLALPPIGPLGAAPAQAQAVTVGQGYDLLRQGQGDAAVTVFEQLVQADPHSLAALVGLGIAYRRVGRNADALATYQRVLERDPDNRLALSTIGLFGEYETPWQPLGIEALTRLLQLEPDNLEARAQRAKLYYYQGLFSQSLADYALVLPNTNDPAIVVLAAEVYTFSGDFANGLALFDRFQAAQGVIAGDVAIAYAQALRDSGQLETAIQLLEAELELTDGQTITTAQARLRGALASGYAANRQFQDALDLVQPLRGREDARLTLARSLAAIGSFSLQPTYDDEIAALYRDVLATATNLTPGIRREAGSALGNLPDHRPLALELITQLAQEQPEDQSLAFQQQVLAFQLGQIEARTFVQQVQDRFSPLPDDPVQVRSMGQSLSRLNPPLPELLPFYQNLVASGATEALLHIWIAQILMQQGRFEEARESLDTYGATPAGQRDQDTTQLLLADLDRREGNLGHSQQRYEQLLSTSLAPTIRSSAAQGLAAVYQAQGRFPEAIALYDQLIADHPQNGAYPLGRAALAYQAGLITEAQAEAILDAGLQQLGNDPPPPALIALATALPPRASRADLYQTLLAVDSRNPQLQLRALQVLADTDPTEAETQARQLVADNPDLLASYFVLGDIAQQTGNLPLARQSYGTVLQRFPDQPDALLALASLEFQAGNYDQAEQIYQRVLAVDADNGPARTSLAALKTVQGRPLAAIDQLQAWQQRQAEQGIHNPQVARQIQQIQESLLLQRGIQPPWERF